MKIKTSVIKEFLVIVLFATQMMPRNIGYKYAIISVIFLLALLLDRGVKTYIIPDFLCLIYPITYVIAGFAHPYSSMIEQMVYFLISFILARYIILSGVSSKQSFERVISWIIVLFAAYSVLGIIEAFTKFNLFDSFFNRYVATGYAANSMRYGIMRGHGVCTISINNGILTSMIWAISAYRVFNKKSRNTLWILCYILIGLNSLLSLSRAVIAYAIIVQCLIVIKCGYKWLVKRIAIGGVILAPIVLLLQNRLSQFFSAIVQMFLPLLAVFDSSFYQYVNASEGIGSFGQRIDLWGYVFKAIKNKILFGWGYTAEFSVMIGNFRKTSIEVHWLLLLFQAGMVGMVGFICYQIWSLKKIRNIKGNLNERRVSFPYTMMLIAVGYFFVLFTCAGFEDLQMFYLLMALTEAYEVICLDSNRRFPNEISVLNNGIDK
mgnify:CR=1 FL=1